MIDIVITANNLDVPMGLPTLILAISANVGNDAPEPITRHTRRGILEAISRLHKRCGHGAAKYFYWLFNSEIRLCSAYRAKNKRKNIIACGLLHAYFERPAAHPRLSRIYQSGAHYVYRINESDVSVNSTEQYDKPIYSPLALTPFAHYRHANLQYLNGQGSWDFFPVLIVSQKTRAIKNSRPPVFGEVITTASQEDVVTLLLALEDLYDQTNPHTDWHFDSLQECLQSPVVYLGTNDSLRWKRLALTTTDHVLHTDKQRAYISLEGVIVKEILDL